MAIVLLSDQPKNKFNEIEDLMLSQNHRFNIPALKQTMFLLARQMNVPFPYLLIFIFCTATFSAFADSSASIQDEPPVITKQPESQSVCVGSEATFTVKATGTEPLTYEWYQDGSLVGTGLNYVINPVSNSDAGNYTVEVSNEYGSVTSSGATLTVLEPPSSATITISSDTICSGNSAIITVTASGSPTLTYQWQYSDNGGGSWMDIDGATSMTYEAAEAGDYRAIVTNSCGSFTTTAVTLIVLTPPTASITPSSASVCSGESATFTVTATGSPTLTYQWQYSDNGGGSWMDIDGATSMTYDADMDGLYRVIVTNSCGPFTTTAVTLTVLTLPTASIVPFTDTVCQGFSAQFTVTAFGSPPFTYVWEYSSDGVIWSPIAGATSMTYDADMDGLYRATVTNSCESFTTTAATLIVLIPPSGSITPLSQSGCSGNSFLLDLAATGSPNLTYQWQISTDGGTTWLVIPGATNTTYDTNVGGLYRAIVTNSCGSFTTDPASVTVLQPPTITSDPANQTVCSGQSASFSVTASGGNLSYQWQKDGVPIPGATTDSYMIASATAADAGSYDVVVSNDCGDAASTVATLSILPGPTITKQPANQKVCEGSSVTFKITAKGTSPLTYQWQKDGVEIPGATAKSYTIESATAADAGSYNVIVTNGNSCSTVSKAAILTVSLLPRITVQPMNQTVCEGKSVSFKVAANGTGTLTYQWQKNGVDIRGATSNTYTIQSASESDDASYDVVVKNACGSVTSRTAKLSVTLSPLITNQPTNTATCPRFAAIFEVGAKGSHLQFQWFRGDVELSDGPTGTGSYIVGSSTPLLCIGFVSASDAGSDYHVVVSNGCDSATSECARLYVCFTGFKTEIVNPACGLSNGSITFCTIGGEAPFDYSIDGGRSFQKSNVFEDLSEGTYLLVVKDKRGCVRKGRAVLVQTP